MVHSYYAVMGGFAFDIRNSPHLRRANLPGCITLTPIGVLALARIKPDLLPDYLQVEQIQDKSKADAFSKFLVCTQAVWYTLQVVTRLAQHLPITLVEITTVCHAMTALLIYCMWWDKPLDIMEPTLIPIRDEEGANMLAIMCARSPEMSKVPLEPGEGRWATAELSQSLMVLKQTPRNRMARGGDLSTRTQPRMSTIPLDVATPFHLVLGQETNGLKFTKAWAKRGALLPNKRLKDPGLSAVVDEKTWLRYKLAVTALQRPRAEDAYRVLLEVPSPPFVTRRARNFPFANLSELSSTGMTVIVAIMLTNVAYGALHLLAWSGPFPTQPQLVLWRVTVLTISAPGLSALAIVGIAAAAAVVAITVTAAVISTYYALQGLGVLVAGITFFAIVAPPAIMAALGILVVKSIELIPQAGMWILSKSMRNRARESDTANEAGEPGSGLRSQRSAPPPTTAVNEPKEETK